MYAIKVTPSKYKPNDWFLMRDLEDFVVHVWSRKTEAEKALARIIILTVATVFIFAFILVMIC